MPQLFCEDNTSLSEYVFYYCEHASACSGLFFLGKGFAIKTTYATILLSVELLVLEKLDPLTHPLSNEPMLELIFAIALPAIASALLFYVGASSGGTDVIAMIVKNMHM